MNNNLNLKKISYFIKIIIFPIVIFIKNNKKVNKSDKIILIKENQRKIIKSISKMNNHNYKRNLY